MIRNIILSAVFAGIAYFISDTFWSGYVAGILYMAIAMEIDNYREALKKKP